MGEDAGYVCTLDEATLKKAREELNEDPAERLNAVRQLREWVKSQPHYRAKTDTMVLLQFLRGAKFSQLRAREMIEKNLGMGAKIPEWFRDIDPCEPRMQEILDRGYAIPLPKRDKSGAQIILYQIGVLDPAVKNLGVSEEIRAGFIVGSYIHQQEATQVNGCVFVFDFSGVGAKHMTRWKLEDMRKWFKIWQKNVPGRFKAFHYLNAGAVFETLMTITRPFMTKKFQERIHLHKTVESLYKHIPMELLPLEYLPDEYSGPHQGSLRDLNDAYKKAVTNEKFRQHLLEVSSSKYGIDEDKRPKDAAPQEAFRKLNID